MKAFITIIEKKTARIIQNRVLFNLQGDCSELNNLIKELQTVKSTVNEWTNKAGLALKDVDVEIEIKELQN